MIIVEKKCLAFKDEKSDKVYRAYLVEDNGGFLVNFEFGKRESKLQTGAKTLSPVTEAEARKIYDKIIKDKKVKGYFEE